MSSPTSSTSNTNSDSPPPPFPSPNLTTGTTTTNNFPTTLAHLQSPHVDPTTNPSFYTTLKNLRRSTLSIPNRLTSILSDSDFVQSVASHYHFPLIPNERCGSWYIPPSLKVGSAYFKSTDGHYGCWGFSGRRLNLGVLETLGRAGGGVLVDSTRRGKVMSDALAKTVPVWVGVINRTLFPEEEGRGRGVEVWRGVRESERGQIEERMEGWCDDFKRLGLDWEELRRLVKRPIRCVWAVNGEWSPGRSEEEGEKEGKDYNLLVLCSASRRVKGAEASEGGYIQGSGDDHEGWSRGLTPDIFWNNKDLLMSTGEEGLPGVIEKLLEERKGEEVDVEAVCVAAAGTLWIGKGVGGREQDWDLVIHCQGDSESGSARTLDLKCRQGKLGSKDLREKLSTVQSFVMTTFERKPQCRILITCDSGRDLSIGVAVVLLCLYYGDDGKPWTIPLFMRVVDKQLVKRRLAWITSSKPDANPSRATLQAVNSFLMDRPG